MIVTQEKQYALRAVLELARQGGKGPVKSAEIARAQAIPERFLEVILGRLKRSGLVTAKRGVQGGYTLARPPGTITVGSVFRLLDENDGASDCIGCTRDRTCPLYGDCVFLDMWTEVRNAMNDVYDNTTIERLMEADRLRSAPSGVPENGSIGFIKRTGPCSGD